MTVTERAAVPSSFTMGEGTSPKILLPLKTLSIPSTVFVLSSVKEVFKNSFSGTTVSNIVPSFIGKRVWSIAPLSSTPAATERGDFNVYLPGGQNTIPPPFASASSRACCIAADASCSHGELNF